jgi:threonine dehydratase
VRASRHQRSKPTIQEGGIVASQHSISFADVREAAERLRGHIRRTPVERSPALSARTGADVWLKCECFQETGSFKLRGALNRLLTLDDAARARGVVTASAGNHGLGTAEAATRLGIRATIVVPETASPAKLHALERYGDRGVELVRFGQDYDAAEEYGLKLAERTGRFWVSPYNDPAVIAGGGTVALDALEDVPDADVLVVPAGGGGLIAGCGVWARHARPSIRVMGVQPEASPALHAALAAGHLVTVPVAPTLADGLAGNIEAGSMTFPLAQQLVDEVALVSEEQIAEAIRWLLAEHHILVEGSAAVSVASLLGGRVANVDGQRIIAVLTGRNIAFETVRHVVCASSPA